MTQAATPRVPADKGPLSTLGSDGQRRWVHPIVSRGSYHRARKVLGWVLIALFVGLPWLRINGKPAILLDLGARQFTFFGKTLFATDTILLPFLAITGIVSIALITAMFGRVWCGWACPQTVYLEFLFRPIESLFEGKAQMRARLWSEPWSMNRILRSGGKWVVFLLVALVLAASFVSYFTSPQVLWSSLLQTPSLARPSLVAVLITAALIFTDFTWFREQTCIIACPYGRIQAALTDAGSLIVGYDFKRGEPRGKRSRSAAEPSLGDCVDCEACVRTCPTGIDIREGLQLECVGCTQCIDACDEIMVKVGKPRRLIRYTSLDQLEGRRSRFLRPRVLVYLAIVLTASTVMAVLLGKKQGFDFEVTRKTGAPFVLQADGRVINNVRLRITSHENTDQQVNVDLTAPNGAALLTRDMPIVLSAHEVASIDATIQTPRSAFTRGLTQARLRVTPGAGTPQERDFVLLGPEGNGP